MKRGFEENVPKVRPRVRLGRALDELGNGSSGIDAAPRSHAPEDEGSAPPERQAGQPAPLHDAPHVVLHAAPLPSTIHASPPPSAPAPFAPAASAPAAAPRTAAPSPSTIPAAGPASDSADAEADARRERLAEVRRRATAAAQPLPARDGAPPADDEAAPGASGPTKRARRGALQVAALAKELSAELEFAADANSRIKADLDGALNSLRRAAEEARERDDEKTRLAAEVDKRTSAAKELLGELELLEAERDGALGQVARFSRELRETRAREGEQARSQEKQREALDEARAQVRRLAAELEARVAERDAARTELGRLRAEKDELSDALLAARAEADEAAESRSALEEIEKALGEARSRISGLR